MNSRKKPLLKPSHFRVTPFQEDLTPEQASAIAHALWRIKDAEPIVLLTCLPEDLQKRAFDELAANRFITRSNNEQVLLLDELNVSSITCIRDTWRMSYGTLWGLLATPLEGLSRSLEGLKATFCQKYGWKEAMAGIVRSIVNRGEADSFRQCFTQHFGIIFLRGHDGEWLDVYGSAHETERLSEALHDSFEIDLKAVVQRKDG